MAIIFKSYPDLVSCAFNPIRIEVQTPAARHAAADNASSDPEDPGFQLLTQHEGDLDIFRSVVPLLNFSNDGKSVNGVDASDMLGLQNHEYVLQVHTLGFNSVIGGGRLTLQVDWPSGTVFEQFTKVGTPPISLEGFNVDRQELPLGAFETGGGTLDTLFIRFVEKIGTAPAPLTKGAGVTFNAIPSDVHGLCAAFGFIDTAGHAAGYQVPAEARDVLMCDAFTQEVTIMTGDNITTPQVIWDMPFQNRDNGDLLVLWIENRSLVLRSFVYEIAYPVTTNTQYHVAATMDVPAMTFSMYVDGKRIGTETSQPVDSYDGELFVGCMDSGANPFRGRLGLLRFFNMDIGAPWIGRLYNGGDPRSFAVSQAYEAAGTGDRLHGLAIEMAPWSCFDAGNYHNARGPKSFLWDTVTAYDPVPLYIDWKTGKTFNPVSSRCELRVYGLMVYIKPKHGYAVEPLDPASEMARLEADGVATQNTLDPLQLTLHIVDEDGTERDMPVQLERTPDKSGCATFDISYIVRRIFTDATLKSRVWGSYRIANTSYNEFQGMDFYASNAVRQLGYPSPFGPEPRALLTAPAFVRYPAGAMGTPQRVAVYNPTGGNIEIVTGSRPVLMSGIFDVIPMLGPVIRVGDSEVPVVAGCVPEFPVFVRWVNTLGGYEHYMFTRRKDFEQSAADINNIESAAEDETQILRTVGMTATRAVTAGTEGLSLSEFTWLQGLQVSPRIEMFNTEIGQWQSVAIDEESTTKWSTVSGVGSIEYRFLLPPLRLQF